MREEKTITRTETVALTRDSREARVALDVLVSRDDVVAASLSAKARGNFGGSDAAAKWAEVTTSVTTSGGANLRCEGGEASPVLGVVRLRRRDRRFWGRRQRRRGRDRRDFGCGGI